MSLIDKFNKVEIKNETRISEEDKKYCEQQQDLFNKTVAIYNKILPLENEIRSIINDNKYTIMEYHSTVDVKKTIKSLKETFRNIIFYYFSNKYNVKLESEKIKSETITNYNQIIDEIFDQLGGYSFSQRAENEIIDDCKNSMRFNNISISKNKLSIKNFFYIDSFYQKYGEYQVCYSSDENFYKLFKALFYFCFKEVGIFQKVYEAITREKNDDVFKVHELCENSGCLSIKLYKNGKIDIVFDTPETALEFAKTYCGYMENVA